jgi:hypothetical protein
MREFREITIPGDVLDDDRLSATAKLLYGKIARLAYKNGYCWASNKFLDGTKSGNTASHNIKELEKCSYVACVYENDGRDRKIYICDVDSRVKKNSVDPPTENVDPPTGFGETPPLDSVNEQYKLNIQKEQPKKTKESFSLSENLNPNMTDFSQRLEILRGQYNALKIGPPFKKMAVNLNPAELSDLMNIMRVYPDDVSLKAMENYAKIVSSPEYNPGGCVYHSFISFMIRGVEKYCDEAAPFSTFKSRIRSPPEQPDDWSNFGRVSEGLIDINALYQQFGITGTEAEKRLKLIALRDKGDVSF